MAQKELPNLKATTGILVDGKHVEAGEVIPKSAFAVKGDWQNLVFGFDPPRLIETDEDVGKPVDEEDEIADKPKGKAASMPGAQA